MPEYLSPGIYTEEVNTGPRPIEGVGTALAAFIGFAPYSEAADVNRPVLITSWSQYLERFGKPDQYDRRQPHMEGAFLSHAVYGYFQNGGGRCYVTRILPPDVLKAPPKTIAIPSAHGGGNALRVSADGPIPANVKLVVDYPPEIEGRPDTFRLRLQVGRGNVETHEITLGQPAEPPAPEPEPPAQPEGGEPPAEGQGGDARGRRPRAPQGPGQGGSSGARGKAVLKEIAIGETTLTIEEASSSADPLQRRPKADSYLLDMPQEFGREQVAQSELIGDVRVRSGVNGMEIAEDVTMLCFPDLMSPLVQPKNDPNYTLIKAVHKAMTDHCDRMHDRMAILDAPPDMTPQQVLEWRRVTANYNSMFAAFYYPWITVAGPDGKELAVPPCGHIAGVYARTDNTRGVHKAPANEIIRNALGVSLAVTKGEQDMLNPHGINCLRAFPGQGPLVWGARTLSSDAAWRYINVRRLFSYVEKSIERSMHWVVFEPNDYDLWARVRRDVGAFLTVCWRQGMLFGRAPEQAFYVKCDEELNTPDVINQGLLIVEIGLAPVKPAEFVVFRYSQIAGGGV